MKNPNEYIKEYDKKFEAWQTKMEHHLNNLEGNTEYMLSEAFTLHDEGWSAEDAAAYFAGKEAA